MADPDWSRSARGVLTATTRQCEFMIRSSTVDRVRQEARAHHVPASRIVEQALRVALPAAVPQDAAYGFPPTQRLRVRLPFDLCKLLTEVAQRWGVSRRQVVDQVLAVAFPPPFERGPRWDPNRRSGAEP